MRSAWKEKGLPKNITKIILRYNNLERSKVYLQNEKNIHSSLKKKQKINSINIDYVSNKSIVQDQKQQISSSINNIYKKNILALNIKNPIMIWKSNYKVDQSCLNIPFKLYNGKIIQKINVSQGMVNSKFGEFLFTRRLGLKKKATQKKQKK